MKPLSDCFLKPRHLRVASGDGEVDSGDERLEQLEKVERFLLVSAYSQDEKQGTNTLGKLINIS